MKILLVNPPSNFLIDDSTFPSLGLLYLSAYLKTNGYKDVELLDLNGKNTLPAYIDKDIVGFYSNTPQFPKVLQLLRHLKDANKNKHAIYVIGGPHVSGKPEDALIDFDAIVVGEGETAILDIAKLYAQGHRFNHDIIRHDYIEDINEIPFPDRSAFDIKKYKKSHVSRGVSRKSYNIAEIICSRGCPYDWP